MNKIKELFSGSHEKDKSDHPAAQGTHGEFLDHTRHNDNIAEGTGYDFGKDKSTSSSTATTGATTGLTSGTTTSPSSTRALDNDRSATGTSGLTSGTSRTAEYATGASASAPTSGSSSTDYTSGTSATTRLSNTLDPTTSSKSTSTGLQSSTGVSSALTGTSTTTTISSGRYGEVLPGPAHIKGEVVSENDPAFREIVQDLRAHGTETGAEFETGLHAHRATSSALGSTGITGTSSTHATTTSSSGLTGGSAYDSTSSTSGTRGSGYDTLTGSSSSHGTSSTSGQGIVGKAEQALGVGSGNRSDYNTSTGLNANNDKSTTGVAGGLSQQGPLGTDGTYDKSSSSTGAYGSGLGADSATGAGSGLGAGSASNTGGYGSSTTGHDTDKSTKKPGLLERAEHALGMK